jgi:hypothetical protein
MSISFPRASLNGCSFNVTGPVAKLFQAEIKYFYLTETNLWEWAIASHGRVLIPLGWLQVIFTGHGFKCKSGVYRILRVPNLLGSRSFNPRFSQLLLMSHSMLSNRGKVSFVVSISKKWSLRYKRKFSQLWNKMIAQRDALIIIAQNKNADTSIVIQIVYINIFGISSALWKMLWDDQYYTELILP